MNSTNSSVLLGSWDIPGSSLVETYQVYCRAAQNQYYTYQEPLEELEFELAAVTAVNMVTITQLQPFTVYQCQVTAVNSLGEGPPSNISIARTSEGIPSVPTNLTAVNITAYNATLRWLRPEMPNGIIVFYAILLFGSADNTWQGLVISDEAEVFFLIQELTPNTLYLARVSASTSGGAGLQALFYFLTNAIREFGASVLKHCCSSKATMMTN